MSNERTIEFIKTEIKVVKAELKRAIKSLSKEHCTPAVKNIIDLHRHIEQCERQLKAIEEERND